MAITSLLAYTGWSAPGVEMNSIAIILFGHAEGCPGRLVLLRRLGPQRISDLEWLGSHFGYHIGQFIRSARRLLEMGLVSQE